MAVLVEGYEPGTIVVSSATLARYNQFHQCLQALIIPKGTKFIYVSGCYVHSNRNFGILGAQKEHHDSKWIQFWDDDHVFPPDILLKLLDRKVDIVTPLYTKRKPPFAPLVYTWKEGDPCGHPIAPEDIPATGIFSVGAAGFGGTVVRREVFDKLEKPWFAYGEISPDINENMMIGEDMLFYKRAIDVGYTVWCDVDNAIGHAFLGYVTMRYDGKQWKTILSEMETGQAIVGFNT